MRDHDPRSWMPFAAVALLSWVAPARAADPIAPGCLAARDASVELGKKHSLRAERTKLLICAAPGCPRDIRSECSRHLDEVNAATPTILFVVTDSAGNDLSAVVVTVDGEPLASRLDGFALPVDPGPHVFTFETAGQKIEKRYIIDELEKFRREFVVFDAVAPSGATPAVETPAVTSSQHPRFGTREKLALGAAAIAAIGLGTGGFLGATAWIKRDNARTACPNAYCADEGGSAAWSQARTWADASTVAFAVGGAAAAGAAILWLTVKAEPPKLARAYVHVGLGGIEVRGRW